MEALKGLFSADAGQVAVNLAEAQADDRIKSWWRPMAGWVCVAALAWAYVLGPMVKWALIVAGVLVPLPPTSFDVDMLTLIFGMLGLGGLRSYERVKLPPRA